MPLSSDFVTSLKLVDPLELIELVKNKPPVVSTCELTKQVAPVDLYCYLFAKFGPPNGIQNFLRSDDSDNLIHWDWTLRSSEGFVIFLGMNFRTEIHILADKSHEDSEAEVAAQLLAEFNGRREEMGEARAMLEHWIEFVNPYQRVRRSIDRLVEELNALSLDPERDKLDPFSKDGIHENVAERWGQVVGRYSKGFGLCFGIRSLLPVLAEAFVNLLLYALLRPEIRSDTRLRDNAFRQPIDVRIKSLSITCVGFKSQPDYSSLLCKAFHKLVNDRNDLLHGNVVIDKLRFNDVYFAGKVPVFKEYRSVWERSLQIEIDSVGLHNLQADLKTINELTAYLLLCVDDKLRPSIEFLVNSHELGLNVADQRVGVLFPGWLVDARSGGKK